MNKFVNILLLIMALPTLGITICVGFDLPIEFLKTTGANLPFLEEMFYVLGVLFLIVGGRRSLRRWAGIRMVSKLARYQWNFPMGNKRKRQAMMYLNLEAVVHVLYAVAIYELTPVAWPVALVTFILGLDHFLFGLICGRGNRFRVGITKNAIVIADRDVKIAYFSGLRRVSIQQQSLFFDYIKDLQISFPADAIAKENRTSFREAVAANVDRDKVYFSEGFKAF